MRVLLTSRPGAGHLYPLLPLAGAAVRAGHEVLVAVAERNRADVERAGFPYAATAHDDQDMATVSLSLPPDRIRHVIFGQRFADVELGLRLPDLRRIVESWAPDIVVHEIAEMAAAVAAGAAGIPQATVSFGPMVQDDVVAEAAASAAKHWRSAGLDPDPTAGIYSERYFDICPPALQVPEMAAKPNVRLLRPVPLGAGEAATAALPASLAHPAGYFTMGTVFGRDVDLFRTVIAGASAEVASLLVTVGSQVEVAALGQQPPNVHLHGFIPQGQVLPLCDLVITHGGSGSLLGALAAGLPVLVLPQGADQFYNARRVQAAGVGVVLLPGEISGGSVAEAVRSLLAEPAYASRARAVAAEVAAMPPPEAAVRDLEELVAASA